MKTILLLLVTIVLSFSLSAEIFSGIDQETGTALSRAAIDTITPEGAIKMGMKLIRLHENNKVTLAYTFYETIPSNLDFTSAKIFTDDGFVELQFKDITQLKIHDLLPVIHEIWFDVISPEYQKQMKDSDNISIEISTISGIPIKRQLSNESLLDFKKTL